MECMFTERQFRYSERYLRILQISGTTYDHLVIVVVVIIIIIIIIIIIVVVIILFSSLHLQEVQLPQVAQRIPCGDKG